MRAHISLLYPRSKWNYSPHTGFTGSEQGRGGREPGAGRGRGRGCRCISPRRTGRRQRCSRRNASGSIHGPLSSRSHSHGGCGSRSLGRLEDGEERLTVVSWCVFFFLSFFYLTVGRLGGWEWLWKMMIKKGGTVVCGIDANIERREVWHRGNFSRITMHENLTKRNILKLSTNQGSRCNTGRHANS